MRGKTVYVVLAGVAVFALIAYGSYRYFDSSGDGSARPAEETPAAPAVGASSGGADPTAQGTSGVGPSLAQPGSGLPAAIPRIVPGAPVAVPLPGTGRVPRTGKEAREASKMRRYEWAAANGKLAEMQEADRKLEERKAKREAVRKTRKEASDNRREIRRQLAEQRKAGEQTLPPATVLPRKTDSAPPATN